MKIVTPEEAFNTQPFEAFVAKFEPIFIEHGHLIYEPETFLSHPLWDIVCIIRDQHYAHKKQGTADNPWQPYYDWLDYLEKVKRVFEIDNYYGTEKSKEPEPKKPKKLEQQPKKPKKLPEPTLF